MAGTGFPNQTRAHNIDPPFAVDLSRGSAEFEGQPRDRHWEALDQTARADGRIEIAIPLVQVQAGKVVIADEPAAIGLDKALMVMTIPMGPMFDAILFPKPEVFHRNDGLGGGGAGNKNFGQVHLVNRSHPVQLLTHVVNNRSPTGFPNMGSVDVVSVDFSQLVPMLAVDKTCYVETEDCGFPRLLSISLVGP